MAVLPFPPEFKADAAFEVDVPRAATESITTGRRTTFVFGAEIWRCRFRVPATMPAVADAIDAWLYQLRSETNTVEITASDFGRVSGPAARPYTLHPDSPAALARSPGGYGAETTLIFREVK